jgi:hypothetical protein
MNLIKQAKTSLGYLLKPRSYSQLGEDLVIMNHLQWLGKNPKSKGFYVDIGAYHPLDGSNTYKFYKGGASGIVVDIGFQKKLLFKLLRRRDMFIEAAVVPDNFSEKLVLFNIDGYGSKTDSVIGYGVVESELTSAHKAQKVKAFPISELLEFSFSTNQAKSASWSILNIDIEGLDEDVIKSVNFEKYPFDIICIEVFSHDKWNKVNEYLDSLTNQTMETGGYSLQSICGPTLIYLRKNSLSRK